MVSDKARCALIKRKLLTGSQIASVNDERSRNRNPVATLQQGFFVCITTRSVSFKVALLVGWNKKTHKLPPIPCVFAVPESLTSSIAKQQAVHLGHWKGYRVNDLEGDVELYNLSVDIAEEKDVAASHPEIVKRIEQIMLDEHEKHPLKRWQLQGIDD